MTDELFKKLIDNSEGRLLDYKICCYNFQGQKEDADAKFVKDIISFSNTVRDSTAYIIFGVKEETNGIKSLIGIDDFSDDAIFQQKTKSRIFPSPSFSSYKYNYDDKLFGIIEVPIYSYARPLVATQKLKGLQIDKIYIRQGSSNEEATHTQTEELIEWLKKLKTNNSTTNGVNEIDELIFAFTDTSKKLSALFGKCNSLRRKVNNSRFNSFVLNELNGLKNTFNDSQEYNYRIIRAPVTPYNIQIPSFGRKNADQMIDYFFERDEFRDLDYLFSKSIFEIELILDNIKQQPKLLILNHPNKEVFPEAETTVDNASIFFGPQMMNNLYLKIRMKAVEWLTVISKDLE
jgi:hypothetical protein